MQAKPETVSEQVEPSAEQTEPGDAELRKPYTAPQLTVHGKLSKITEERIGSRPN
jgi:hypothetical protein